MRLLLLVPSSSYRAADFLAAAERLGVDVLVACNGHQTLEETSPGKLLTLDFLDLAGSTEKVIRTIKRFPIAAVVPTEDDATLLAATLSEALSLPHNRVEATSATRDKSLLRERLLAARLPTPRFQAFSTEQPAEEAAQEMAYPLVLKPTFLSGSQGVIRANNQKEFIKAFERIKRLFKNPEVIAKKGGISQEILVEEYIPGKEVALEGLLWKGKLTCLALFDKCDPLEGPFFEETIYVTPSRLSRLVQEKIAECIQQGAEVLGLEEGPVHAELRINGEALSIIEIAARSIGGRCSKVLQFSTGATLEEIIVRHALGMPIASLDRQSGAAGVMMMPIPGRGVLNGVQGLEGAEKVPGIKSIEITAHLGQTMIPLPEGRRYLGFICSNGETPGAVEAALRKAHQKLQFNLTAPIETSEKQKREKVDDTMGI